MSYCWWEEQRWKVIRKPPWKPCTKQRTVGRKDVKWKFHTQAYLSSIGKVMKRRRVMEQQCLLSPVEGRSAQRRWWDRKHGRRWEGENTRRWHYIITPSDIVGLVAYWTDQKGWNHMRKMKTGKWRNELVQEFTKLTERLEVTLQLGISAELAPDRRCRRKEIYSICCPREEYLSKLLGLHEKLKRSEWLNLFHSHLLVLSDVGFDLFYFYLIVNKYFTLLVNECIDKDTRKLCLPSYHCLLAILKQ